MNTVSRPLARAQPSGAACLSLPSTGHNSPDPIALHMQAGTQLPEPLHGCALQDLAAAQQAIAALQSIDLPLVGGKPCKPPKKKTRCRRDNAGRATPRIYPLRTTPIGHSADPHSRLTNRKARRLVNEVEAHGLSWTYMDNKKALSIYLLRAL